MIKEPNYPIRYWWIVIIVVPIIVAIIGITPELMELLGIKSTPSLVPTATPMEESLSTSIPLPTTPAVTATPVLDSIPTTSTTTISPTALPLSQEIAVLIVEGANEINWLISSQITSILQNKGRKTTTPLLFSDEFVSTGKFERLFRGNTNDAKQLKLATQCQYAILGKHSMSFDDSPELIGVITAIATLEIHIIDAKVGTLHDSFSATNRKPGFSREEAQQAAIEGMIQDVADNIYAITQ